MNRILIAALFFLLAPAARGAIYEVTNNPYEDVNWSTMLRCQSTTHEHTVGGGQTRILAVSNAGYCAAAYHTYSGGYRPNTLSAWNALGDPVPDPGIAVGWAGPTRPWPPESYGQPAVPINSLRFYLPLMEDAHIVGGSFGNTVETIHMTAVGLTNYFEGEGCDACSAFGPNTYAVRNNNPFSLAENRIVRGTTSYTGTDDFITKVHDIGLNIVLNHPAHSVPSTYDARDFDAMEMYNGFFSMEDEGDVPGTPCAQNDNIAEMRAVWDHQLQNKSARIWGTSVSDWAGTWQTRGIRINPCWPLSTDQNMDRGKLEMFLTAYDLTSWLEAFDKGAFVAIVENNATKSTYPKLDNVVVTSVSISLSTIDDDETVNWIGNGASVGTGWIIDLTDLGVGLKYLRAEISDGAGRVVYTQPFEINPPPPPGMVGGGGGIGGGRQ